MFTLTDICNIAIQIEQNGAATYHNASKTIKDPKLAEILAWMAKEEENHARWFESIQSDKVLTTEQMEMETVGRTLLQEIIQSNTFSLDNDVLKNTTELADLIAQSIEFERDTILFYEILLDLLEDDQAIEKLNIIIREERNHVTKLKSLSESDEVL